jgi:hypothetical protein
MADEIRPEVAAFARLMEAKLREHDPDRPEGWKGAEPWRLGYSLGGHVDKMIARLANAHDGTVDRAQAARDIADCLNFLMMIADTTGVLEEFRGGAAGVPDAGAADGEAGKVAPHPAG